ncbi:hypothetical protein KPH14_001355 [Odynerus spinipes]|uniref:Uncharacterized protein n=1 Tax=Odynerus spinipes TaxID=1348599 RepID=A0AAD9RE97_9HYME|nr:hypothetical protein KPH14_001355 [Odynerus spinipes]
MRQKLGYRTDTADIIDSIKHTSLPKKRGLTDRKGQDSSSFFLVPISLIRFSFLLPCNLGGPLQGPSGSKGAELEARAETPMPDGGKRSQEKKRSRRR